MWISIAMYLKDILYLGVIALLSYLFYRERKELLNRIMARNYEQYEYYDKMFKSEVQELDNLRKDSRKKDEIDEEIKKEMDLEYKAERDFIEKLDEDWPEEEVDLKELRTKIKE